MPPTIKGMGTVVPFTIFVFTCALSIFLQGAWLDGQGILAAFSIVITTLPESICTGKAAEIIIKGGGNMIKYLKSYLTVTAEGKTRNKVEVPSEWVN